MENRRMYKDLVTAPPGAAPAFELPRPLPVKVGTDFKMIEINAIVYIRASGNYVGLVMVGGETVHTKETISHIAERLPQPPFLRIRRSLLVNCLYIKGIKSRGHNYEFALLGDVHLLSGTTFRAEIRERVLTGLRRGGRIAQRPVSIRPPEFPNSGAASAGSSIASCVRIRECEPGDEQRLALLGKLTFMETYSNVFPDKDLLAHCVMHDGPVLYAAWIASDTAKLWMAETEFCGAPVGYLALTLPSLPLTGLRPKDLEIQRLYLLKHFQGAGLGAKFVALALRFAKEYGYQRLLLAEYSKNSRAIEFFHRFGFDAIGDHVCRVGRSDYQDTVLGLELR